MQQKFFEILAKQYPNKILFVPNLGILLFFAKFCYQTNSMVLILNIKKVFKNLKILAQKYPNKAFLVLDLVVFVFSRNFAVKQIRGL